MGAVFAAVLKYAAAILPALPQLIAVVEALWKNTPKSGSYKWIAIERALSNSIGLVAQEVSQLAPNTPADTVAAKVAIFTKAVNDAFVKLLNDLGIFQTS